MSFNLCCTTYQNLGCFSSCAPLNTEVNATEAGEYSMLLEYNGGYTEIKTTPGIGNPFVIEKDLNENYNYKLRINNPDGTLFGCYKFSTKLVFQS